MYVLCRQIHVFMCASTNAPCMYNFPIQNRSDFGGGEAKGGDAASLFLVPLLCPKIFDILFLMEDSIRAQSSPSRPRVHLIDKLHNLYFLSLYPPTIEHQITTLTSILNMKIPQWPPPDSWPPPSRSPNSETIKGSQNHSTEVHDRLERSRRKEAF